MGSVRHPRSDRLRVAERDKRSITFTPVCEAIAAQGARNGPGDGLPWSTRLLSETHRRLLAGALGATKQTGAARRSQNGIGGTRPGNAAFVPPPPHRLPDLLSAFERAMHGPSDLPPLVRAGLLHAQLEACHPYLDGFGRLGRMRIMLWVRDGGVLRGSTQTPVHYP